MTTVIIPETIFKLFQNEIQKINLNLLENICKIYEIDINEAKEKLKDVYNINFELEDINKIKYSKKHKEISQDIRCKARIYKQNEVIVSQCMKKKIDDCEFCKKHERMFKNDKLQYGTIDEPIPEIIEKKLIKKKKNTLI